MTGFARWVSFSLFLLTIGFVETARAAAFDFNDTSWEGCTEMLNVARQRLGAQRVVLVANLNFSELTPADGLVVIHPTVSLSMESLNDFMLAGGRVAVLDDFGSSGPFLERFNIRRTNPPFRPAATLRENPNLAWAVPAKLHADTPGEGPHGLVYGLNRVLTNHPIALTNPGLTPVLEIPALDGMALPLAISGLIGKRGRLLVVGDPSVVINMMLRYPENRGFAEHLVEYMVSDDSWGARGGKLYLVANGFSQVPTRANLFSPQRVANGARNAWSSLGKLRIPEYFAWILGLALSFVIGHKAWVDLGKRGSIYRPKFASAVPLVSHPGMAGRAAVLGAPSTPRSLIMLELMMGVTSYLASLLGIEDSRNSAHVFETARERLLINSSQFKALDALSKLVVRIQTALTTGGRARVRQVQLDHAYRLVLDIVDGIEHRDRSDSRATSDAARDRTSPRPPE